MLMSANRRSMRRLWVTVLKLVISIAALPSLGTFTRAAGCRGTAERVSAEEDPWDLRAGAGIRRPKRPRLFRYKEGVTRAAEASGL